MVRKNRWVLEEQGGCGRLTQAAATPLQSCLLPPSPPGQGRMGRAKCRELLGQYRGLISEEQGGKSDAMTVTGHIPPADG